MLFDFRAFVSKPYQDGDSLWVELDQGLSDRAEEELRLLNVHAPELHQPGGRETAAFVADWLAAAARRAAAAGSRWPLYVLTVPNTRRPDPESRRTFTRYLATVYLAADADVVMHAVVAGRPVPVQSLNDAVNELLAEHPEWPSGE